MANISKENEKKLQTHVQRLEALNKANTDMLKNIMAILKKSGGSNATATKPEINGSKTDQQQKQANYKKRFDAAIPCVHCKKKHPNHTNDKCWELDANAAS